MKYEVKNSDVKIDGKVYPEGTIKDFSDSERKGLEKYLVPVTTDEKKLPSKPSKKTTN